MAGSAIKDAILNFEYERDTKNKVRYSELPPDGEAPVIGKLYIDKALYAEWGEPSTLKVRVSPPAKAKA